MGVVREEVGLVGIVNPLVVKNVLYLGAGVTSMRATLRGRDRAAQRGGREKLGDRIRQREQVEGQREPLPDAVLETFCGGVACPGWMPGPVPPTPSHQPLCLPLLQVHVPGGARRHEHPARQHQRLLRTHHRLHQRVRLRPLRCLQLWGQCQGQGLRVRATPPWATPRSPVWT